MLESLAQTKRFRRQTWNANKPATDATAKIVFVLNEVCIRNWECGQTPLSHLEACPSLVESTPREKTLPIIATNESTDMSPIRTGHIVEKILETEYKFPTMPNIRRLFDRPGSSGDDEEGDRPSRSFTGGHTSGLAVEYPDSASRRNDVLKIRVFSNGFIIGSGGFRSFNEPENVEFLSQIRSGEVPAELSSEIAASGGELKVELTQLSGDYDPLSKQSDASPGQSSMAASFRDAPKEVLFNGEGSSLGGSIRPMVEVSPDGIPVPRIPEGCTPTRVQIRLPGGARIARIFDQDALGHSLIGILEHGLNIPAESFTISAGFPPRPIEVSELRVGSFKELGLCNSNVIVTIRK